MNTHYDRYLVRKYEPLYRNRYADMRSTAMCWGFEVGDGWFNIINTLSAQLCQDWLTAKEYYVLIRDRQGLTQFGGKESKYNQIVTLEMIRESILKMEQEYEKVPVASQVKEKFGGLRFYVDNASERDYNYINFAESLSYKTCEVCGKPGKASRSGWISVRCKDHR